MKGSFKIWRISEDLLKLELTEKEKNDLKTKAETDKGKKPSKTLSPEQIKERLTEAQKESIRAAFVQGVNREKEVYYPPPVKNVNINPRENALRPKTQTLILANINQSTVV